MNCFLQQHRITALLLVWILGSVGISCRSNAASVRPLPRPLAHHPGNIFLSGEEVTLPVPNKAARQWSLSDVSGSKIAAGQIEGDKISLGQLGVGFYRITWSPAAEPADTALAVLEPLAAPIPDDSPICIHATLAGNYILGNLTSPDDAANVLTLAGINSGRDSAAWTWLASDSGSAISGATPRAIESLSVIKNAYEKSGLKLLLLTEPGTPPRYQLSADWGARPRKKFSADYRDYAAYVRELVTKSNPIAEAYEAWNEPEGIGGGYIGSEIATAMKVFRLAARSVDPKAHVAMGVGHPPARSMFLNGYADAIDSYHYHSHSNVERTRLRRHEQDGYTGELPVWVTESSYGSYPLEDRRRRTLTAEAQLRQAMGIPKLFSRGLHDGNERLYYFCAFDFTEVAGETWGLLMNQTLEPRPAYVAMAAAGRLLAGAKPLGALRELPEGTEGWLVESVIGGTKKKVVVVWKNDSTPSPWNGIESESAWDLWGRKLPRTPETISAQPVYLVLKADARVSVIPPMHRKVRQGIHPLDLSPVVADYRRPDRFKSRIGDFFLLTQLDTILNLDIYNFGTSEQKGTWTVEATDGIIAQLPEPNQTLAAGERTTLNARVRGTTTHADGRIHWIHVTGQFTDGPRSRLSLPVVFCPEDLPAKTQRPVAIAGPTTNWHGIAPSGSTSTIQSSEGAVTFAFQLGDPPNTTVGTTWATASYRLKSEEAIPNQAKAVTLQIQADSIPVGALLEIHLIERSGAAYACALPYDEKKITAKGGQRFLLPFALFVFEPYRKPHVDAGLNLDEVISCEISINTKPHEPARLTLSHLAWVLD